MADTYVINAYCFNCSYRASTTIPKGVPIDEHPCPNCGVAKLSHDPNAGS